MRSVYENGRMDTGIINPVAEDYNRRIRELGPLAPRRKMEPEEKAASLYRDALFMVHTYGAVLQFGNVERELDTLEVIGVLRALYDKYTDYLMTPQETRIYMSWMKYFRALKRVKLARPVKLSQNTWSKMRYMAKRQVLATAEDGWKTVDAQV
jgi:hypothetical protein